MSNIGGKLSVSKRKKRNPHYLQSQSPRSPSGILLRKNTTMLEAMTIIQVVSLYTPSVDHLLIEILLCRPIDILQIYVL
jgi:hypothetical protein